MVNWRKCADRFAVVLAFGLYVALRLSIMSIEAQIEEQWQQHVEAALIEQEIAQFARWRRRLHTRGRRWYRKQLCMPHVAASA